MERIRPVGDGAVPVKIVAAFRTHTWDDEIAQLAQRFFAAVPSSRQVVLVDETRGPIAIPGYEKISHTDDMASFGLPNHPRGGSLWFNGDYALYALQRALPDFDYYLVSESDLAVNVSLEPIMRFASDEGIDLIAHQIEPSDPSWHWHDHGLALSPAPWRSLLFLVVLSRRAIMYLLEARQQLADRYAAGEIDPWPFCEAFVPTILKLTPGMRFGEVSAFASTGNLAFRPRISLHDARANLPGSLVHPVLGGKRFIAALLAMHPPRNFFQEGSELRERLLSQIPFEDIVEPMRRALASRRDHAGVTLLYEEAEEHGWGARPVSGDVAFCKPAMTSSVSRWSRYQDREYDACGANGEPIHDDYGFHTEQEADPWWMVDLLRKHEVEEVAIVNRRNEPQRFRSFRIETSIDGRAWTARFTQGDPADVSSDIESPRRVRFEDAVPARYVRIVLLGKGPLHLRRVQVFGRALAGRQCLPGTRPDYTRSSRMRTAPL
jgi:hypothetical protein